MPSLSLQAQFHDERTALIDEAGVHTYRELLAASHRIANALLHEADDLRVQRVAFLIPANFAFVAVLWGWAGLHNLRIAVKKLRYALETLDFAAGAEVQANVKFFKKLQTALGEIHDRDVFIAEVKARYDALQKRAVSATLSQGYEAVFQHLLRARRVFYEEYVKLFGEAKLSEWQKRVVPPLPRRVPAPKNTAANVS